ncbi:hypothetical protein HYU11_03070 [Candidatus Woesearchaeota archaeon]|nr:hypothetical protein [Candidatus Woesearchaeota archaeon]
MRYLRPFEEFIKEGTIRKGTGDKERAKSLIIEAERKKDSSKEVIF